MFLTTHIGLRFITMLHRLQGGLVTKKVSICLFVCQMRDL